MDTVVAASGTAPGVQFAAADQFPSSTAHSAAETAPDVNASACVAMKIVARLRADPLFPRPFAVSGAACMTPCARLNTRRWLRFIRVLAGWDGSLGARAGGMRNARMYVCFLRAQADDSLRRNSIKTLSHQYLVEAVAGAFRDLLRGKEQNAPKPTRMAGASVAASSVKFRRTCGKPHPARRAHVPLFRTLPSPRYVHTVRALCRSCLPARFARRHAGRRRQAEPDPARARPDPAVDRAAASTHHAAATAGGPGRSGGRAERAQYRLPGQLAAQAAGRQCPHAALYRHAVW
ncbi:Uncharacterised protein [Bordetella pertussis]|nr:Uncharacterised protein [Bordetella pertussis]